MKQLRRKPKRLAVVLMAVFGLVVLIALTAYLDRHLDRIEAQFTPAGSIVYSSFLGGSQFERAQGCAVDATGNIYLVGNTYSPDFPITGRAFQNSYHGGRGDGWVAKLAPDGKLVWATYLGGRLEDRSYGVRVDQSGVYVVTWTNSPDFPTTSGAFDTTHNGDFDIAVSKLNLDGTALIYSTFVGGSAVEQSRGSMYLNSSGDLYVAGFSESPNFPVTSGAYQSQAKGKQDGVVFKLSADGSKLLFSSRIGGSEDDDLHSEVWVHSDGTVYLAGTTQSSDFPTTPGVYQQKATGNRGGPGYMGDSVILRLAPDASRLIFSTYLGGSSGEETSRNHSLAVDSAGNAIILGNTTSTDFPTTPGAFQRVFRGGTIGDGYVAKLSPDGSRLLSATYLGGAGSEETSGLAIDRAGNVYLSGNTDSSDYPVTPDAFQKSYAGGMKNVMLTKLSPDLANILYSTYLGGSGKQGFGDRGRCVVLDASGRAIVSGDATSADFPVSTGAVQTVFKGDTDAFVAIFDVQDGSSSQNRPAINPGGTVNAATFANGEPLVAGSGASLFGMNLASSTAAASAVPLPFSLGGATVQINNVPAPLFFASPAQINFQLPWDLSGQSQAALTVTVGSLTSRAEIVSLASYAPGVFTTNFRGTGQGAVLVANSQGMLAAPSGAFRAARPVKRGEYIEIYASGLGPVTNPPPTGAPAPLQPLSLTTTLPTVTLGGVAAPVSFSGLAVTLVGTYQVNAQVPSSSPVGDAVPLTLVMADHGSNTVTIAVE